MSRKKNKYNVTGQAVLAVFLITLTATLLLAGLTFLIIMLSPESDNLWSAFDYINIFILFCQIIVIVAATIIGGRYNRNMKAILSGMEAITEGNFEVEVELSKSGRGLSDISNYLNIMAKQLKSTEMLNNDFVHSFSHELKTPIVSINGFAKRLLTKELPLETKKEYLEIIYAESNRLVRLSENILALSKLENQEIVAGKSMFSLDDQIRQSVLLLQNEWSSKDITVDIDIPSIYYFCSPELLKQVWLNLLSNAIKFSSPGGEIRIRTEHTDNLLSIMIEDDGIGMNEETKAKAVEKYFQGEGVHAAGGTGLGLSIVKRITELIGGGLEIFSRQGEGSVIKVLLPLPER